MLQIACHPLVYHIICSDMYIFVSFKILNSFGLFKSVVIDLVFCSSVDLRNHITLRHFEHCPSASLTGITKSNQIWR